MNDGLATTMAALMIGSVAGGAMGLIVGHHLGRTDNPTAQWLTVNTDLAHSQLGMSFCLRHREGDKWSHPMCSKELIADEAAAEIRRDLKTRD
jgi:hypothetical protein